MDDQQLTDDQILAVLNALKSVWWNNNLLGFCKIMNIEADHYGQDKFTALSTIAQGLDQFDRANKIKLVRAGLKTGLS